MRFAAFRRNGFTHVDLLVTLALVLIVAGFTIAARTKAVEDDLNKRCQSNLKQIGSAVMLYSNENRGAFPRTVQDGTGKLTFFTNPIDKAAKGSEGWGDPMASKTPPGPNDITAAMFMLLRTQDMGPELFVCPSTTDKPDTYGGGRVTDRMNFEATNNVSYSFINVYPTTEAIGKGYRGFLAAFPVTVAIASDLNPGSEILTKLKASSPREEQAQGNSPNHGGIGQNVLYADGRVEFQPTPLCGAKRDNIFTYGGPEAAEQGVVGTPVPADDSVLLPTAAMRTKGQEVTLNESPQVRPAAPAAPSPGSDAERIQKLEKRVKDLERQQSGTPSQKK